MYHMIMMSPYFKIESWMAVMETLGLKIRALSRATCLSCNDLSRVYNLNQIKPQLWDVQHVASEKETDDSNY